MRDPHISIQRNSLTLFISTAAAMHRAQGVVVRTALVHSTATAVERGATRTVTPAAAAAEQFSLPPTFPLFATYTLVARLFHLFTFYLYLSTAFSPS